MELFERTLRDLYEVQDVLREELELDDATEYTEREELLNLVDEIHFEFGDTAS